MNPITYSINQVKFLLPEKILKQIFFGRLGRRVNHAISLDTRIREEIIERRVLPDCNLIGGTEEYIPLHSCKVERVSNGTFVWYIPKSLTQQRKITTAIQLCYGNAIIRNVQNGLTGYSNKLGTVNTQMNKMVDANKPVPVSSNPTVKMITPHTLAVQGELNMSNNYYLNALLENDANMNNLKPAYYKDFSTLVVLATKAYCYVNAALEMEEGYVQGGVVLGQMGSIIDSFDNANEEYDEFLNNTWRQMTILNDHVQQRRHYALHAGGGW